MQIFGFIVLLVAIIASRMIHELGYRKLDSDAKLRLMDGFSKTRAFSMIPLLLLIGVYFYMMSQTDVNKPLLNTLYFGLLLLYIVVQSLLNQRKLSKLNMPADYRKSFTISQIISLVGVAGSIFVISRGM